MTLTRPVDDRWPVSQPYGYDPDYPANGGMHYGIDYAAPVGTPCWFRESGTVSWAGFGPVGFPGVLNGAWGYYVEIVSDRDPSVRWGLAHLSKVEVRTGMHVEAGQVVGLTGGQPGAPGAGTSTGPHLHEQCIVNGERPDPDSILPPPTEDPVRRTAEQQTLIDNLLNRERYLRQLSGELATLQHENYAHALEALANDCGQDARALEGEWPEVP